MVDLLLQCFAAPVTFLLRPFSPRQKIFLVDSLEWDGKHIRKRNAQSRSQTTDRKFYLMKVKSPKIIVRKFT